MIFSGFHSEILFSFHLLAFSSMPKILIKFFLEQVQTIRQGYLSKRSSNLRGDWKRRFFVLDSRGMLYYYRKQSSKPSVSILLSLCLG